MASIIPFHRDPHHETQMLLPWYAKGRLDEAERERVEAHIAGCEQCAAELRLEQELALELADLPSASDAGWARLSARMVTAPRRDRAARKSDPGRRGLAGWGAIAAVLCLAAGVGLGSLRQLQAPIYQTLGARSAPDLGSMVVIFRPDAREQDLRRVLTAAHVRFVDGPTAAGGYVLRAVKTEPRTAIAFLRRQPEVVLAQPIEAEPSR